VLSGPSAFPTIGRQLVDAVTARLQANGLTVPDRASITPAPIVWDDCQCGLLAVAVPRIFGSHDGRAEITAAAAGPQGAPIPTSALPSPSFLVGEFQVAVLRCADATGTPSADTLAAEASEVHADGYWALVAVACELQRLREAGEIEDYTIGDTPFLPTQGGCQGAQVNATASVPFRCPCD
jgi:hypothetical protein